MDSLYEDLVEALHEATVDAERARRAYGSTSTHDMATKFFEACGYHRGLARAIEILDEQDV